MATFTSGVANGIPTLVTALSRLMRNHPLIRLPVLQRGRYFQSSSEHNYWSPWLFKVVMVNELPSMLWKSGILLLLATPISRSMWCRLRTITDGTDALSLVKIQFAPSRPGKHFFLPSTLRRSFSDGFEYPYFFFFMLCFQGRHEWAILPPHRKQDIWPNRL